MFHSVRNDTTVPFSVNGANGKLFSHSLAEERILGALSGCSRNVKNQMRLTGQFY
jgi:hypothetical protein